MPYTIASIDSGNREVIGACEGGKGLVEVITAISPQSPLSLSLHGWLNPVTGALVHNAGSLLVVFNALLYDGKFVV